MIAREPRGSNGFGYDPVFLFPGLRRTYAELSEEDKNRHSHRARAVALLLDGGFPSRRVSECGIGGSGSNGQ